MQHGTRSQLVSAFAGSDVDGSKGIGSVVAFVSDLQLSIGVYVIAAGAS